ncbi:(2Fe-2S) ferredoxin domain-containing protein [Nocardioides alkalitolerans]|uniref:(2Fe-2S) ferredoxin domain-containing protein n=1 Tax=Nocardioides alkalitolerans TaxID=281714 RepID=UPI00040FFD47|nr:(2Fe-2S) ferredoxin domain-containing protein [Nocardioides alkalitolerans]
MALPPTAPVDPVPTPAASTTYLLVGMSLREHAERERLDAAAATLHVPRDPDATAGVAFLQVGDPSLAAALTDLADAGVERVVLLGVSLGTLAPANSWLRRVAGHWWRERGEPGPDGVVPHRPVVEVATAMMRHESDLELGVLDVARAIHGREAPLHSDAWETVPAHRHQVLVCRGPRCSARGGDKVAEALATRLRDEGLGDDDVLVTQTACQFPCNQAPVVTVQPDDVWYGALGPDDVPELVAEHLVAGRPLERLRLVRRSAR